MNDGSSDRVSVIVPFLNGSDWLIEALKSVLHQTCTHWEIIVIDDGSEEKHTRIAKEFCNLHKNKILYTEHKGHVNKGVTISRNEAAKLAKGKYLAFLDADDVWLPQKLANQLSCFASHPEAQMVCESTVMWHSWNDKNAGDYVQVIGAPPGICYLKGSLTKLLYPLLPVSPPAPSGIMITKEAFKRVKGFESLFSGIYELYEDQAFLSKVYLQEVVFISEAANTFYRKRNNSMSSAAMNEERYFKVRAFYLNWLQAYLIKHKIKDNEIDELIEKAKQEIAAMHQLT